VKEVACNVQHKACREIMANSCKMIMLKKVNGKKPFFVTCDFSGKPKPPHQNICVVPID
jgi:hypothetical protein